MSEKTLNELKKNYPLKVKAEVASIGHLNKGLTLVEKNQEAKFKAG